MGKGRVITDHGEGLYTIELIEDRVRAETNRTLAEERITSLDARTTELEADLANAQAGVDSAADTLDQAIAAYQADPTDELRLEMNKAGEVLIGAAAMRDGIAGNIRALKTEKLALQKRIDRIDALPALRQQQAWCADLTEQLAGDIATAEVPGEATQVLVRPGFNGEAVYDQARDGALQPALSGTPASVYYNLAMLPGWQKWRPTYRIATITAIAAGADSCDIDMVPATSSEQGLNVNAESSYAGVPIQYMTCHANAFQVSDRVLVRFDPLDQSPTVIGFESHPRGCGIDTIVAVPVTLYYNDDFPFSVSSPCACGQQTPTDGMIYTARAMDDYVWRFEFGGGVEVFDADGNRAAALNAADYSTLPAPDHTVSESHNVQSIYRTPTKYTYDFPVEDGAGGCTTNQDDFSRLAITDDSSEIGGGDPFFNGELNIRDNGSLASITLDDEVFTVAYEPQFDQQEWESLEHGVYTTADDGTDCTALFLLSKDRQEAVSYDNFFSLEVDEPQAIRRLPTLTINGQEKRPLGVFHLIPGENEFSFDSTSFTVGGQTRIFGRHFRKKLYLMVGYGR